MIKYSSKYSIKDFPPQGIENDRIVLAKLMDANKKLAYLNGIQYALPNPKIIIDTLPLQEAQDSSSIENIVTTSDQLYRYRLEEKNIPPAVKEVRLYASSVHNAIANISREKNLITQTNIKKVQEIIIGNDAGYRKQAGTVIMDVAKKNTIYTPPQDPNEIAKLMDDLVKYINTSNGYDPLIKMALIHHQFESIHPFYDGNGRTGRILNLLFLIKEKQLSQPILYLSRFINHNKSDYYHLLEKVKEDNAWTEWVIYMLTGIANTAEHTTKLIEDIRKKFAEHKKIIKENYSFYSQDLINHIYANPYTKIKYLQEELDLSRPTATKYLDKLTTGKLLTKIRDGRDDYYINHELTDILFNSPSLALDQSS